MIYFQVLVEIEWVPPSNLIPHNISSVMVLNQTVGSTSFELKLEDLFSGGDVTHLERYQFIFIQAIRLSSMHA